MSDDRTVIRVEFTIQEYEALVSMARAFLDEYTKPFGAEALATLERAIQRADGGEDDRAIQIVERHQRQVLQSPGVGLPTQRYALNVLYDVLQDLAPTR